MRHFSVFIYCLLAAISVKGQSWHLNKVDKASVYPYEYWFHFENEEDSNSYVLNQISTEQSIISLLNNSGKPVFADLNIRNSTTDSIIRLPAYDSIVVLRLDTGSYTLEIFDPKYDELKIPFQIIGNQIRLDIGLGLAPDIEIYQINAKENLSPDEINQIIHCVRGTREFFQCSDKKRYQVLMHI